MNDITIDLSAEPFEFLDSNALITLARVGRLDLLRQNGVVGGGGPADPASNDADVSAAFPKKSVWRRRRF